MYRFVATTLVAGCLFSFANVQAQEFSIPEPTKEHQWLSKFVGQWVTDAEASFGPDQPTVQCDGKMDCKQVGKFWVMTEMTGEFAGMPTRGIQTLGYDPEKKKYVGTWIDTMTSYMWKYEGEVDESGKTLTLAAEGPHMMIEGKTAAYEDIYEFQSDQKVNFSSRMKDDEGNWITFMKGTATKQNQ